MSDKNWYLTWYLTFKKLKLARTASAAWKAKCKQLKELYEASIDLQIEERDKTIAAEKRVAELEDGLMSLLDGLDSNYDERCGLTSKEWEQRIKEARATLNK